MKLKGLDEKWMKWVRWTLGEWVWVPMRVSEKVPMRVSVKVPMRVSEKVPMRVSEKVSIRKSLSESPYQTEWESPYQKVPIKLSLSNCPYQNVHIKISILPFMIQIVVLLELGWASIQQPIIKSIILIDLNEHLKNLEDSLDRHRAWRHTKVI